MKCSNGHQGAETSGKDSRVTCTHNFVLSTHIAYKINMRIVERRWGQT